MLSLSCMYVLYIKLYLQLKYERWRSGTTQSIVVENDSIYRMRSTVSFSSSYWLSAQSPVCYPPSQERVSWVHPLLFSDSSERARTIPRPGNCPEVRWHYHSSLYRHFPNSCIIRTGRMLDTITRVFNNKFVG